MRLVASSIASLHVGTRIDHNRHTVRDHMPETVRRFLRGSHTARVGFLVYSRVRSYRSRRHFYNGSMPLTA